jgi:hypothetical protein
MARVSAVILVVNLCLLATALRAGSAYGIAPSAFYRDPVAVLEAKFVIGWFSNLGVVLWISASTICLFTAATHKMQDRERKALLILGLLTLALGLDDLFMLHDGLLPFLGLSGIVLYAIYALVSCFWIATYWREIMQTRWVFLAVAVALLGFSAFLDVIVDSFGLHGQAAYLVEDAAKLTGISFWAAYAFSVAWQLASRTSGLAKDNVAMASKPAREKTPESLFLQPR